VLSQSELVLELFLFLIVVKFEIAFVSSVLSKRKQL